MTHNVRQLFEVKRSRSQGHVMYLQQGCHNSAVDGHINLVEIIAVGADTCRLSILYKSVGQI